MNKEHLHKFLLGLFLFLGFVAVCSEGVATDLDSSTAVRVLLDKAIPKGRVQSLLYSTYYRGNPAQGWARAEKSLEISVGNSSQYPVLVNSKPFRDDFVFVRGGQSPSDKLKMEQGIFRGALKWVRKERAFSVINYLSLEDYLLGTLGSEMSPSWELEALKAQAVASRTYALHMIQNPRNEEYDLEKTTQDQVYGGVEAENPRIKEAIFQTRNQILLFNKTPIKAFFHSRCGGSTETPQVVWNHQQGYPQKKVSCPYCIKFPFVWQTIVKAEEILKAIGFTFPSTFRMESAGRSPSGRLASLKVVSGPHQTLLGADVLRSRLGYAKLKSAKFDWHQEGDEISFQGVGNGHGVGMCQWGARYLAQQGKNYREILSHYYPGATLQVSH
jgi:stage II sporulation protein D